MKCDTLQGVTNFVMHKFGHLNPKEWQTMYDLAKMFLHCLNHWKLETPTSRASRYGHGDIKDYKINYTRWGALALSVWGGFC